MLSKFTLYRCLNGLSSPTEPVNRGHEVFRIKFWGGGGVGGGDTDQISRGTLTL